MEFSTEGFNYRVPIVPDDFRQEAITRRAMNQEQMDLLLKLAERVENPFEPSEHLLSLFLHSTRYTWHIWSSKASMERELEPL